MRVRHTGSGISFLLNQIRVNSVLTRGRSDQPLKHEILHAFKLHLSFVFAKVSSDTVGPWPRYVHCFLSLLDIFIGNPETDTREADLPGVLGAVALRGRVVKQGFLTRSQNLFVTVAHRGPAAAECALETSVRHVN